MPKLFLSDPAMAIMIVQSLLQKGTSAPRDTTYFLGTSLNLSFCSWESSRSVAMATGRDLAKSK